MPAPLYILLQFILFYATITPRSKKIKKKKNKTYTKYINIINMNIYLMPILYIRIQKIDTLNHKYIKKNNSDTTQTKNFNLLKLLINLTSQITYKSSIMYHIGYQI